MKTPPHLDAALAWSSLGLQWLEMMAASGQVIARRTRREITAAQWITLGSEKMLAAVESAHAMGRAMIAPAPVDAAQAWDAWARILASGMRPYHARATRNARRRRRPR